MFPKAPEDVEERIERAIGEGEQGERITAEEIKKAVFSQSSFKAPGEDQIVFKVIKEVWGVGEQILCDMYRAAFEQGYHAERWKRAVGVIIPKPGKGDYKQVKSYRPISLLSTVGKVLEKVLANRLSRIGEEKIFSDHQWGGREQRSAEECVVHTLWWAERKKAEGKKIALIAMDIGQAFPNTSKTAVANTIRRENGSEKIARWVESFMSDRTVQLRFDGGKGGWSRVETGIPQGSPASPVLFNIHIAPVLKRIEEIVRKEMEGEVINPTFIDDVTLVVAGDDWEEVMKRAKRIIEVAYEAAEERCMKWDSGKMEWIRLWKERGEGEEGEEESLELPDMTNKRESKLMRWLGIWIDDELKWKKHVEIKVEAARRAGMKVTSLAKGLKGMGVGSLRNMYIGCARQVMEYGMMVWWKGQEGLTRKMDKENERAMRKIGGHLRTAPGAAVEVEGDVIPVGIRAEAQKMKRMARLMQKRNRNHPLVVASEREEEEVEEREQAGRVGWGVKGMVNRMRKKKWGWGRGKVENWKEFFKGEKVWEKEAMEYMESVIREFKGFEEERQRKRREEAGEVLFYVDGSKIGDRIGVGACRAGGEWWSQSWFLGKEMEVVDAEMVGIKKAMIRGLKECRGRHVEVVTIVCDSQQAISRAGKREASKGEQLAYDIRWLADAYRQRGIRIRLEWCKAHVGIAGNERADRLAKDGTEKRVKDVEGFTSFSYIERRIREETIEKWEEKFQQDRRRGSQYEGTPIKRHDVRHQPSVRYEKVLLSRLRTGHLPIRKYLKKIGKREDEECQCGGGEQSVRHIMEECVMGRENREEAREKGVESMETMLYSKEGVEWGVKIYQEFVSKGGMEEEERLNWLEWGRGDLGNE